jgi:integrase
MQYQWKVLEERFGDRYAQDITIEDCRAYTAERKAAGISNGTIRTELGRLRMVLNWAKARGFLSEAPAIEKPPMPPPKVEPLDREEVQKLLAAAVPLPYLKMYVTIAMATAARDAAVLDLTWNRVNWKLGQIELDDPKLTRRHKKRPIVPINDMLRAALLSVPEEDRHGHVVTINGGGRMVSVTKGLTSAAKRAGISHVHPHKLRHTAACHMLQAGVPIEKVSEYLGHSSIEITKRIYARYQPKHLRDAAAAINY